VKARNELKDVSLLECDILQSGRHTRITLKMERERSSEISVNFYQNLRRHIPEEDFLTLP
jgi:hypothetical protein